MGGEAVDRVYVGAHRDALAKDPHFLGAIDDVARQRAVGGESDKHDA